MFWQSVLGGLNGLLRWQVWVAIAIFFAYTLIWTISIGIAIQSDGGSYGRRILRRLTALIGGAIVEALLLGCIIALLTPVLLGDFGAIPISELTTFTGSILIGCFLALLVSFVIYTVPVVDGFIDILGVQTFIKCVVIFRVFSAQLLESLHGNILAETENLYPGFWESVGYLIAAMFVVYACYVIIALLVDKLSHNRLFDNDELPFTLTSALDPMIGILSLLMYASGLTLALGKTLL